MATLLLKKYTYFIGIDISKNELDFAVMQGDKFLFHREIKNDLNDIYVLIQEIKHLPKFTMTKAIFCMENTGIYGNHLVNALKKYKANVVIEHPAQIKGSLGNIRGKNDKADAIRIAEYAYRSKHKLRLFVAKRPILKQLAELNALKNRLSILLLSLKKPLKEQSSFVSKGIVKQNVKLCKRSTDAIENDLMAIEQRIQEIIQSDEALNRLMKIITSVSGIGPVTALQIILCTNEFKDIKDPKKFACYSGVAPFLKSSGIVTGKSKVSHLANKKMKTLLHLCARNARRCVPELKSYFERKTSVEGKNKMLVFNAIRYKLILRVFACVNQGRLYQSTYQRPAPEYA